MDGGHQAINFNEQERRPSLLGAKCVGCHLCKLVCPQNAITTVDKRVNSKKNDEKTGILIDICFL